MSFPRLPSGRIHYALFIAVKDIISVGNMPSALTVIRDIGRYVARTIPGPRTLNEIIFTYNEVLTQKQDLRHTREAQW